MKLLVFIFTALFSISSLADITITLTSLKDPKKNFGRVTLKQMGYGVLVQPRLDDLNPGLHDIYLYEKNTCDDEKTPADKNNMDNADSGEGLSSQKNKKLRRLSAFLVLNNGQATTPFLIPNLEIESLYGHTLILFSAKKSYAVFSNEKNVPSEKIACGAVPAEKKSITDSAD